MAHHPSAGHALARRRIPAKRRQASTYEHTDATPRPLVQFLVWLRGRRRVVIHFGLAGAYKLLIEQGIDARRAERRYPLSAAQRAPLPPAPRLQQFPRRTSASTSSSDERTLLDCLRRGRTRTPGTVRIPIDEAMRLTVERGLPVAGREPPTAPQRRHDAGRLELGAHVESGGGSEAMRIDVNYAICARAPAMWRARARRCVLATAAPRRRGRAELSGKLPPLRRRSAEAGRGRRHDAAAAASRSPSSSGWTSSCRSTRGSRTRAGATLRSATTSRAASPVVLAFVYYRCPMLCTQVMNGISSALKAAAVHARQGLRRRARQLRPARHAGGRGREEADAPASTGRREATARGWHFLTGDEADDPARSTSAAGFTYQWDERTQQFAHVSGVLVVTPDGRLSRYFYGIEYSPKELRLALVESGEGHDRLGDRRAAALLLSLRPASRALRRGRHESDPCSAA